jgi:MFS transporter, putative metabolite transport protein
MHLGLVIGGFVLFNLAMNAGPNSTTFTLAPTLFPTSIRGSAAGFAAASAKIGADIRHLHRPAAPGGLGPHRGALPDGGC